MAFRSVGNAEIVACRVWEQFLGTEAINARTKGGLVILQRMTGEQIAQTLCKGRMNRSRRRGSQNTDG